MHIGLRRNSHACSRSHGKNLCRDALSDLDFTMNSYRLNRYDIHFTTDAFTVPIWPIFATIKNEKGENIGGLYKEEKKYRSTGTTIKWRPDLQVFTDINIPVEFFIDSLKRQAVVPNTTSPPSARLRQCCV